MKIGVIAKSCCIRVVKQICALVEAGHTVFPLISRVTSPDFLSVLPPTAWFEDADTLAIRLMDLDVDLLHVHNEPNWPVRVCAEARPELPVVWDIHDLNCIRMGIDPAQDELDAAKACAAVVYPSQGYRGRAGLDLYDLTQKPSEVVFSMCNRQVLDVPPYPKVNGIVYQGGISASPVGWEYQDYRGLAQRLAQLEIPFHLYGAGPASHEPYISTGAVLHPTLRYFDLLRALTRYDWGLVGTPIADHPQWRRAMPNKLFEYLAVGLPVICLNAEEAGWFVQRHGVGVVVDSVDEIPGIYAQHRALRQRVAEVRHQFVMENQVPKLERLYQHILKPKAAQDEPLHIHIGWRDVA